jgi:type I restriction enzyme S subunit
MARNATLGRGDDLTAAADTRRRLLDALFAEALAPAEDREMEAAE